MMLLNFAPDNDVRRVRKDKRDVLLLEICRKKTGVQTYDKSKTEAAHDPDLFREVSLPIDGMTCASCVRRVEKALTKVEGVSDASVNLATEKAKISFDPRLVQIVDLTAAVEKAGYKVPKLPEETQPTPTIQIVSIDEDGEATLPIEGMTVRLVCSAS